MDSLYSDLTKLLIEHYFGIADSLALFCTSKQFLVYQKLYRNTLLYAKKGINHCIINGNLDACQFLYSTNQFNISQNNEFFFRSSCEYGHLAIVQWIIKNGSDMHSPIDIHNIHEYAFRVSCYRGYFDIAYWLIQLGIETNSPIDIHANIDFAFRWSCDNNHPNIVRWLVQLGTEMNSLINIHACNESAFIVNCVLGNLYITRWLIQLGIETNSPIDNEIIQQYEYKLL